MEIQLVKDAQEEARKAVKALLEEKYPELFSEVFNKLTERGYDLDEPNTYDHACDAVVALRRKL